MKITNFKKKKHGYLIQTWSSNKDFKGNVLNQALQSLEITFTFPRKGQSNTFR